jgi:hypothetical protein
LAQKPSNIPKFYRAKKAEVSPKGGAFPLVLDKFCHTTWYLPILVLDHDVKENKTLKNREKMKSSRYIAQFFRTVEIC